MASLVSHAVVALSIGTCFYQPRIPKRVWIVGTLCSLVPDIDVIGFRFGIRYGDFWGHRGFTHSLVFAILLASAAAALVLWRLPRGVSRLSVWIYFLLATVSHGVLDAMTDGGLGVAFFSPFDNRRYFLPWRPIRVSPIGFAHFFTSRGLAVLQSELLWVWLPAGLLAAFALALRRRHATADV